MEDDRRRILDMLVERKITADEAELLLKALDRGSPNTSPGLAAATPAEPAKAKFLRVMVDSNEPDDGPTKVNIRVPMQLLRAGVRLSSLIPSGARDEVNAALKDYGMPFDLQQLKPENLEEMIDQLKDLTVDVDQEKTKVRIFCE